MCVVTPDLVQKGIHASDIIRKVAAIGGGSGGGRPHMAQAGVRDIGKLDQVLAAVPEVVREVSKK